MNQKTIYLAFEHFATMGFERFLQKLLLPGGMVIDALKKSQKSGKSFFESYVESVKEYYTDDLPVVSHFYQAGRREGRKQGTIKQAKLDKKKIRNLNEQHEDDRRRWNEEKREYEELLRDIEKSM